MLANPTARERGANARMGDEDAAEALSATGRLEGSVGETLRGEPPDDPRMGRDGSVGPGPVVRGCALLATSSRAPQAGSYTGIIEARLEEFPGLSAKRLFDEGRAAGYHGGYSRVRDYVRAVRPREPVEAVVRFETPAGRQGPVDFATFTLPWGRRHALVVVLSHSRLLWLRFYRRQTMAVLTEGLERAFARFGGVPKELPARRPPHRWCRTRVPATPCAWLARSVDLFGLWGSERRRLPGGHLAACPCRSDHRRSNSA